MPSAYNGVLLHVDLTHDHTWVEEISNGLYRKYLGGTGLSTYFLCRDMKSTVDPLGPDNILILMTSAINGLPFSGINRYSATAKSPLTGGLGTSHAGGYWGPELKRAGFDGLIIHGRAPKPVYAWVHDGKCELRDASHYWGRLALDVQRELEEELGDRSIRVLQTGIAGENQVLFSALVNQLRHFHGRTGLGAVMASKNLKAVVVRGRKRLSAVDKSAFRDVQQWWKENSGNSDEIIRVHGTAGYVPILDSEGILPTCNFQQGSFEFASDISGERMSETILTGRGTCFACTVACKREVELPERGVICDYGGMEYETVAALGSLCGIGDLATIAEGSHWVNAYVLDSMSTGAAIAFAMECFENGIINKRDTDGIELVFGNADAMLQMIHKIARREGIGDVLADGVKRAAAGFGGEADRFAMHVKGQELPMHEPRVKRGLALHYALSPQGADHGETAHDPQYAFFGAPLHWFSELGLLESIDRLDLGPKKIRAFQTLQMVNSMYDCVGMCIFVGVSMGILPLSQLRNLINAATGWDMSLYEMMKVGERAKTMARVFNVLQGFTATDDTLPARMFEPLGEKTKAGMAGKQLDRNEFERAVRSYYQMMGWDDSGVPTVGTLMELGLIGADVGSLDDVVADLA